MKTFTKATTAGGACKRCGSLSFTAKRSKLGIVAFGFLARKRRTRCNGCGRVYRLAR